MSGLLDEAIGSLKKAIEFEPKFAESAKEETDFDSLKTDSRFLELIQSKIEVKAEA